MSRKIKKYPLNVFTDFHHAGLLSSLITLFEKRLKGKVYRPVGMEWLEQGYWKVYDHPETAKQYLSLDQRYEPIDGSEHLNQITSRKLKNPQEGVYYCKDISSRKMNKAITLERFKELDIDVVIASIPEHIKPFKELIQKYQPNAKLIYQIGNQWNVEQNQVKNVMASALVNIPDGVNGVIYHQEFDTDIFSYVPNFSDKTIASLVNCFDTASLFSSDWEFFKKVEKLMPDYDFKVYGGGCRDGSMNGEREVAWAIENSRFIWHVKRGGDGYGHIIHNAFAMGRPPIVKMEYYKDKLAGKLMIDGETCIAIDGLNPQQVINKIENADYKKLGQNAYMRFVQEVDFDQEEQKIQEFLKLLK